MFLLKIFFSLESKYYGKLSTSYNKSTSWADDEKKELSKLD